MYSFVPVLALGAAPCFWDSTQLQTVEPNLDSRHFCQRLFLAVSVCPAVFGSAELLCLSFIHHNPRNRMQAGTAGYKLAAGFMWLGVLQWVPHVV